MIEGFAVDATGLTHVAELSSGRTLCGVVVAAAQAIPPRSTCGSCVAESLLACARRTSRDRSDLGSSPGLAGLVSTDGIVSCGVLEAPCREPAAATSEARWSSFEPLPLR
ncbi:hypothetical protein [Saccharopolyspora gloriosae]|uniref:hypothetical protein n=1 Tax=Saccharopolyspora gloriosae TaxID=455344 RepID=UPI001FB80A4D|nr:hypothetical protein [Saccharopolyspora gloriosae]